MSADEILHPDQFIGPMYHGSPYQFNEGDMLTTRGAKKALLDSGVRPQSAQHRELYVTGSLGMASAMAGEHGHIYRVEPTGSLHHDPEVSSGNQPSENITQSYMTTSPVRIKREEKSFYSPAGD